MNEELAHENMILRHENEQLQARVNELEKQNEQLQARVAQLRDTIKDVVEYSGGADKTLSDEYVLDRLYQVLAQTESDWLAKHDAEQRAKAVPEGWKLALIEPTEEMLYAGGAAIGSTPSCMEDAVRAYRAMLAAAPQPDNSFSVKNPVPDASSSMEPTPGKTITISGAPQTERSE